MKLKPYPEYKNSGVEWIGEIPKDWEIKRLKHFTENLDGKRIPISAEQRIFGSIPYYGATGVVDYVDDFIFDEELLLIGEDGAPFFDPYKDVSFIIEGKSWVNNHAHVLRILEGINIKILMYQLNQTDYAFFIKGSTRDKLNQDQLKEIPIIEPPEDLQARIIFYLNKKTSEIDLTIEKDSRLIELLQEKRTALINHVVTKGLDPEAPMKDSGIEWMGEIPEGWEIKKLKYVSDLIPGQSPHESTYNTDGKGSILVNGPNEYSESDFGYTRSLKWTTAPKKWAPSNSLLFCMRGSTTGRLNIAHTNISIGRGVAAIVAKNDHDYLNYIMITLRPYVIGNSRGSTFPSVTTDDLGNYLVPEPPSAEQTKISRYLGKSTLKIDKTIQKIRENIGLLDEYKKSLIHHAVTGKVDIRDAV